MEPIRTKSAASGDGEPGSPAEGLAVSGWRRMARELGFVARAPLRHKALSATCFVAMLAAAALVVLTVPVRYRVEAVLLAQRAVAMSGLSIPGMNREWDVPTRAAREIVIDRQNLLALCRELDVPRRYLETRAPSVRARDWLVSAVEPRRRDPEALVGSLADAIQARLSVATGPDGTITIAFEWSDRDLALDVVRAVVRMFLEERYASEIRSVAETIAMLESRDEQVQKDLAVTMANVVVRDQALRVRVRVVPAPTASAAPRSAVEDLARLQLRLDARRRALADMEALRQRRITEMEALLAQQQTIYAPRHPVLAGTRKALETLSRPSQDAATLRREVQELESEISRRTRSTPGGDSSLPDLAALVERLAGVDESRLGPDRRELSDQLREHSRLVQRIAEARVELDTAEAAFRYRYTVVRPPEPPRSPTRPHWVTVLGGVLGGLALAVFAAAAADVRDGWLLEAWQVERELDLPVVGELHR